MLVKFGVIAALGPPVVAVFLFEVLLNATSMFNHGNVRLAGPLDRWLRCFLVTPDMHRVHHSVEVDESNSNFGFNLPWWDRLFGTYRAQPRVGHTAMSLGVEHLLVTGTRVCSVSWRFPSAPRPIPTLSTNEGSAARTADQLSIMVQWNRKECPDARNRVDSRRRGTTQGSAEQVPRSRPGP